MLSLQSSRLLQPRSRAVEAQSSSDEGEMSDPRTEAVGKFNAVMAAWLVPQPATQMRGSGGTVWCVQSPRFWLSMTRAKSGSAVQSSAFGRQGKGKRL